jgi:hypothetical protein
MTQFLLQQHQGRWEMRAYESYSVREYIFIFGYVKIYDDFFS